MSKSLIEWGRGEPGNFRRAGDVVRLPDGTWFKLPAEVAKAFDDLIPSGDPVEVALSLVTSNPTAAPALIAAGAKIAKEAKEAKEQQTDPTALLYEGASELAEKPTDWAKTAETAAVILAAALRALL